MDSTLNKSLLGNSPNIEAGAVSQQPPKRKVKLYTTSVFIVAYVIFVIASSSGLLICALWPLCNHLGGSKIQLGLLVGIHAVGKTVMAQPMATLTEKYKHGHALFVGMVLLVIGGLLFAFCPVLGGIAMLYIAQLVLGTSFAAMGTARAFIVEQTRPNRRTYVLGRILALDYCGHFMVPIIGVLFIVLGDTISTFMKFAVPALVVSLLGAGALYLLYFHFQDIREEDEMTEADFNPISKQVVSATPAGAAGANAPPSPVTTYRSPDIEQSSSEAYVPPSPTSSLSASFVGRPASPSPPPPPPPSTTAQGPSSPTAATATGTTAPAQPPSDEKAHQEVFQLIMLMNFALRSCMAVYATLATEIILNNFELSFYALGGILSGAGTVGVAQMLGFKQLWTNNFSDAMLLLVSFCVLGFSQVFVVNWVPKDYAPDLWNFVVALYAVFAVGLPVGISAAIGAFSVLQRAGRQSAYHSQLILLEGVVYIIVPVLCGVLEECVRKFASFSVVMMIMGACIVVVMQMYEPLMRFTDRAVIGAPPKDGLPKPLIVLDNPLVRQFFVVMATFLALAGFVTLLISIFGRLA